MRSHIQSIIINHCNIVINYERSAMLATTELGRNIFLSEARKYKQFIRNLEEREGVESRDSILNTISERIGQHLHQQQEHHHQSDVYIQRSTPIVIPENFRSNPPANIPTEFICPITMEIMTDPVVLSDGQVYERQYIEKWLKISCVSPLTKVVVKNEVIPCFALRSLIQKFVDDV